MIIEITRKILDRLINGIFLLDSELKIIYVNQFILGASKREIFLYESIFSSFPEIKNTRIEKALIDAKEKRLSCFLTHNLNKEQFPFYSNQRNTLMKQNIYINPILENKEVVFILIQIIDSTYNDLKEELLREKTKQERILNHSLYSEIVAKNEYQAKLLEQNEKLEKANKELLKLDAEKNELLSVVAHDLRNPLMMMQTLVDNLNSRNNNFQTAQEISILSSTVSNLIDFVNNLLNIYSIQTGNIITETKETNLQTHLIQVIERHQILAREKQITINYSSEIFEPNVMIDVTALQQALENYLSNAIKFSNPNSKIEVFLKQEEKHVIYEVRDEGPGLSELESKELFKKFSRLSPRPTGNEKSTGLGLFITKKYIEGAGGRVWVNTKEGVGSSFYFLLPWYNKQKKETHTVHYQLFREKTFLYIDDDEITRRIFKNQMLQISRFVDIAESSTEALQMMKIKSYDVVFIDMNLGNDLGINVIKMFQEMFPNSSTKYVLCSGDVSRESVQYFKNYGFDYAMPKDFRIEKLSQVVEQIFLQKD